jgi:RNA polymerase sigma-70 factor (ECF subfamily)
MATSEFQQKLLQLQKHLYHFAFRLTSNADNARDLLQETNLKALNYSDRFEYDTNFKAWIFTIMKNTFINNYRRRINFNIINGFDGIFELSQIESVVSLDPASMLETKQLEKIVESIDDKLKVPFKMKHEGFKYKEIAEKLDIKLGTVKSRIFIARKILMKHLNEDIIVLE